MPYINKENRIFLSEESHEYGKIDINKIKGEYIKANITEDKIAILIDDDVRILNETKNFERTSISNTCYICTYII